MGTIYKGQPPCFVEKGDLNMTSAYGTRINPVTGELQVLHSGVDCTLWTGYSNTATICSMYDGEVIEVYDKETSNTTYANGRGNYVKIRHNDTYCTLYQHLQKGVYVKVGQKVKKGEKIAYMGNTGRSTGAHLHVEVYVNGATVDPLPYVLGQKTIDGSSSGSSTSTGDGDLLFCIYLDADLKQGATGNEVKKLQVRLARLSPDFEKEVRGHSITAAGQPDGIFGAGLGETLKKLQKAAGLAETGELDAATRAALNRAEIDDIGTIADIKALINEWEAK